MAIAAGVRQDELRQLEDVRRHTYAALRSLARKTWLSRVASMFYCMLLAEIAVGVPAAAALLLSIVH